MLHNTQHISYTGIATTAISLTMTWVDKVDEWMRIGASAVAIVSGIVVMIIAIRNRNKK